MPQVTIRGFGSIRDLFNSGAITIETTQNTTIKNIIDILLTKYSGLNDIILDQKTGKPKSSIKFLLNEESIELTRDEKKKVKDGDILAILPPVGGG